MLIIDHGSDVLTKSESYKCDKSFTKENQFTDHVYTETVYAEAINVRFALRTFLRKIIYQPTKQIIMPKKLLSVKLVEKNLLARSL